MYNQTHAGGQKTLNFSSTKTSSTTPQLGQSIKDNTQTNSKSGLGPGLNTDRKQETAGGSNLGVTMTGAPEYKTTQRTMPSQEPFGSKTARTIAKAGDPKFVSEFYNNSRLHHISTWGAEFKAYVNSLQSKGDTSFPGREKLKRLKDDDNSSQESSSQGSTDKSEAVCKSTGQQSNRVIMHIDMDCFFVSVGLIDKPELHGKPVAVTHSKGKGMPVVNQEAREYERAYYQNKFTDGNKPNKSMDISTLLKGNSANTSTTTKTICNDDDDDDNDDNGTGKQVDSELSESTGHDTNLGNRSLDKSNLSTSESADESESLQSTSTANPTPSSSTKPPVPTKPSNETFSSMAEIASCSYEARKAGIRNGMFMGRAKELCPELQMIPYDFDGYKRVSQTLYETVARYVV